MIDLKRGIFAGVLFLSSVAPTLADGERPCELTKSCQPEYIWLEAFNLGGGSSTSDVSFSTAGLTFNVPFEDKMIALGYRVMDQDFLSSRRDRNNNRSIDGRLKSISLSRVWHWPARFGYLSSSVGLGYISGEIGKNCDQVPSFLYAHFVCETEDVSTMGVPLRVSAGFGRYAGIAVHMEANINADVPYFMSTISIPLGKFARR